MISTSQEFFSATRNTTDPRRELLDRVLSSSGFAKSGRLSALLVYLCELTLEGRDGEISEQAIGQAVFGRPQNYDSANDGIVRTQSSRLRQKLDLYFETDGSGESVRIVIPRGGYVPFFVPHEPVRKPGISALNEPVVEPQPASAAASDAVASDVNPPRHRYPAWTVAAFLALALFSVLARDAARRAVAPPRHPLWSQVFPPGGSTLIVPADSTLVFWQALRKRNIDLAEYLKGSFRDDAPAGGDRERAGEHFGHGRYTSIVDLEASSRLSQLAIEQKGSAQIRYARDVRPNDLKEGNAILLGTTEANPWVSLFEKDMNFFFRMDRERKIFSVVNRAPQAGEASEWNSLFGSDKHHDVYGVVAYRPNLSGNGKVLILEGTSMAGTECAWDFVADDSRLLPFLQQIESRDGSIPYFELVLGTNNMSGSAVRSSILAWRVQGTRSRR